jgi:iron complex outermembrane receptor protein
VYQKTRICKAVALLLAAAAASQAPAQQAAADSSATVVITGSRIARPNLISATPVLSVTPQSMSDLGIENFADMATQLTQFSAAFGESRTQSTFSGVGVSGLNRANLRNLGPVRSLVLINGRRVPGGSSTSTAADFNSIPTANIERVEVITGGASAIYGADAVAGVINIITKKNVQGIELSVSYGASEAGDNEHPTVSILAGGKFGDAGRASLTFQYDKQGQVSCADRYLCSEDFAWTTPTNATRAPTARSGIGVAGRFIVDGKNYTRRNGSFTDSTGKLIEFSVPVDGYNRNGQRDLAIPTTRVLVAGDVEYKLGKKLTAFGEFNFAQNSISSRFEGHPFQSSSDKFGGSNGLSPTIPVDNPFIPAALKAIIPGSQTEIQWLQRFGSENIGGNRGAQSDRNMARTVIGIKGELDSLAGIGRDWRWEASNTWGRTRVNLGTQGLVGLGQLYYGLRVEPDPSSPGNYRCTDAVARSQGCVPINPFAPYTQAMSDYLSLSSTAVGQSGLNSTAAHINGVLTELPAGSLRVAAGVERRSISGDLDYDTVINKGLATGNQIQDVTKATTITKEVFVEALIPILADKPFVNSLNLETAYRHSSTRTGNYDTWKFGGDWEPITGLRFRAVKARSVRAPVAGDLSGGGETAGVVNDPCINWGAANVKADVKAACAAAGIPDNYDPILLIRQGVRGFEGGNPNLRPEVATTLTYGFVWQPPQLKGLSVSVDRFDIKVDDVITTVGRQLAVDTCYSAAGLYCGNVRRGSTPLLPGANYVLLAVDDRNDNLAQLGVSGVDLEARYAFKLGAWGDLDTSMTATFYDEAFKIPRPGEAAVDLLDQAGGSTSDQGWIKRTASFNFTHRMGALRTNWNMRHIGSAEMNTSSKAAGFPRIGAHTYHNVRLGYQVNKDTEVSLGVTNLFDKKPPFFGSGRAGTQALDTIPAYYDVFGRSYSASLKMKF